MITKRTLSTIASLTSCFIIPVNWNQDYAALKTEITTTDYRTWEQFNASNHKIEGLRRYAQTLENTVQRHDYNKAIIVLERELSAKMKKLYWLVGPPASSSMQSNIQGAIQ